MEISKEFIKLFSLSLKPLGFIKRGNSFYLESNKNYGIINFQKSRDSTREVLLFTINFGIYSDILGHTQNGSDEISKPEIEQCQWQSRIGSFMPGGQDYWWKVNLSDDLNRVASNVIDVIQGVIMPELGKRLSDEGLINCWLNESFAGTTEIGRFKYLTTLLKRKGYYDTLKEVVDGFMQKSKGKPIARMAMEHLMQIGYNKQ